MYCQEAEFFIFRQETEGWLPADTLNLPFYKNLITLDATFSIQMAVYSILEATVSKAIHDEIEKNGKVPPVPIEQMLAGILQDNMDRLEKSCYVTQTPDKTYLAGGWLMRPAWNGERMIPMIELLKQQIDCTNVVFLPQEDGVALRKKLWDKPINEIMEKMDLFPDFKDI